MPIYMKIDGIQGSVMTQGYEGWIEVDSFQLGATNPPGTGSNLATTVSEIYVTKTIDKASVKLMGACAKGVAIRGGSVEFLKPNSSGVYEPYLNYRMADVLITNYQTSGSGNSLPYESLGIAFRRLDFQYTDLDDGTTETGGWPGSY